MKSDRLFSIVNWLLERRRATAPELAARFEVSVRTIYRDIESLCIAGVPIIALQGYEGGFELAEGFTIDRAFLSQPELSELMGALRGFDEALKVPALSSTLGKLAGLGAGRARSREGRAPGRRADRRAPGRAEAAEPFELPPPLLVTLTPWGGRSPDAGLVELFRRAIDARAPVRMAYESATGEASERVVEPLTIALGGAVWYVHAWCRLRRAFRLFRLSRVRSASMEAGPFDPCAHGEVPGPFHGPGLEPMIEVTLEAPAGSRMALGEAFSRSSIVELPGGRCRASFAYPEGDWLVRLILSLGAGVEVISPVELRDAVRVAASAAAELNGPPTRRPPKKRRRT